MIENSGGGGWIRTIADEFASGEERRLDYKEK